MRTKLAVEIVRFVDNHQPGWVEVQFVDIEGRRHSFIDKIPTFVSSGRLESETAYPQPGIIVCTILSTSEDQHGRAVAHITTTRPYYLESTDGLSEFDVLSSQLSSD
jgi:hypothetical protein